jgi:TPR repeat protein
MYLLGEGVPSNPKEGLQWPLGAADQSDEAAFRLLADLYRNGYYGVPLDLGEAERWDKRYRDSELFRMSEEKRAANASNAAAPGKNP